MSLLPISIPKGFTVIITKGDKVLPGQVIAERQVPISEKSIPLAKLLDVHPKQVAKFVRKNPGDSIKEGEVIAKKASGISVTDVISSIQGTFLRLERETGDMVVDKQGGEENAPQNTQVVSPFEGSVEGIDEQNVLLRTGSDGLMGEKGFGGSATATLLMAKSDGTIVDGSNITVEMIGNIVLGPQFSLDALAKASGMGVAGIVGLQFHEEDILMLSEKRMLLPILEISEATFRTLAKAVGKKVYLDSIAKTILVS